MKRLLAVLVGAVLTGLILWMVLGGINVWRRAAFHEPPDGGPVKVHFINATGNNQRPPTANGHGTDGNPK